MVLQLLILRLLQLATCKNRDCHHVSARDKIMKKHLQTMHMKMPSRRPIISRCPGPSRTCTPTSGSTLTSIPSTRGSCPVSSASSTTSSEGDTACSRRSTPRIHHHRATSTQLWKRFHPVREGLRYGRGRKF